MKVNVSVVGRFHAFNLANELQNRNILNKLITTYPKSIATRWNIKKELIISEVFLEILRRYKDRIPFFSNNFLVGLVKKKHAIKSSKFLRECDIFIGWSGSSLETLIEAKKLDKITILERGSSHYNYQMKILMESSEKFIPDYNTWQRELLEYELVDFISIPSSFVKRTFIENGIPEKKLLVNPYGVDLSEFKQIKKSDNIFRVIFCGSLSIQKGSHYLLEAIYKLDLPNFEFWHIGSVKEEMEDYINKYKSNKIIFKGHQPQNMLYKFYSEGSVFVIPSLQEGMAMVQLQAMACGLPLICSTNSGGDDLITKDGEEGFVIPIRDTEAIKEKILYMYNNQEITKQMGQKAKNKVEAGFTWKDYGDRYLKNLKEIYATKN